jgi:hypothetical protein
MLTRGSTTILKKKNKVMEYLCKLTNECCGKDINFACFESRCWKMKLVAILDCSV